MPRVRRISLPGVDLIFYSNDHPPPHFHAVKHDHWHYRVFFQCPEAEMLEQKSGPRSIPGNTRRDLVALAALHRMELLEEWEASRPNE